MLVPRYELSSCHTHIKLGLLGFSGIGIFAFGLLDRVFKRIASETYQKWKKHENLKNFQSKLKKDNKTDECSSSPNKT